MQEIERRAVSVLILVRAGIQGLQIKSSGKQNLHGNYKGMANCGEKCWGIRMVPANISNTSLVGVMEIQNSF